MSDVTRPTLFHDTYRILYATDPACALFKCASLDITDREIIDLVVGEDFKTLAKIHMQIARERNDTPEVEYPFIRCDLTVFWAKIMVDKIDEGVYSMTLRYTFEEDCHAY